MTQPEDLFQKLRDNQGFVINDLPAGTKVSVNTKNSLYEFVVIDNRYVSVFGGTKNNDIVRFSKPTKMTVLGSSFGDNTIIFNWVGKGMLIKLIIEEGEEQGKVLLTSPVENLSVESDNDCLDINYILQ